MGLTVLPTYVDRNSASEFPVLAKNKTNRQRRHLSIDWLDWLDFTHQKEQTTARTT